MALYGIREVRAWRAKTKKQNLEEWYRRNSWARNDTERDIADEDYPGRGLEFEFFEIPN